MSDWISKMNDKFPKFAQDFVDFLKKDCEITDANGERIINMLNYNCLGGKAFRGIQVRC